MKSRMFKSCCLLGVLLMISVVPLLAQDEDTFSASISMDYASRYVWRGQNLDDSSVFQFNAEGSAWGFTGAIWSNMPLTDTVTASPSEFNEIDYSLDFSRNFTDKIGYSLGVIHYTFAGYATPTTEIYGGVNFDVPLSPSVTWYRDVDSVDGSYVQFGIGHAFEKLHSWNDDTNVGIELGASFGIGGSGYNAGYFNGLDKVGFNDLTFNFAVPFNLKHGISITPSFNLSTMLDGDVRDNYYYGHIDPTTGTSDSKTNVWFGISLSKSF